MHDELEYELEYDFNKINISGTVKKVTQHNGRETHTLSVTKPKHIADIARFTIDTNNEHDKGETVYRKNKLGLGNLLAGALLLERQKLK